MKRDNSISAIRLLSMLMIITCHILQGLQNKWAFWVNVGVQLFFFVSGFLYGKKIIADTKEFYVKRVKTVYIPYMIILIISLILELAVLQKNYSLIKIAGCFMGLGGFFGSLSILSHTWFVSYILLCYLLVPVLQKIFNSNKFKRNYCIFIMVMIFMQLFQIFVIKRVEACWINNFIVGYFYSRCCTERKNKNMFHVFVSILSMVIIPLAVIYQEKINISLPDILNQGSGIIINYGHVLLGTILFIILYKLLNILKIKQNKLLIFSDKYSYYIYLVHQIFILNSFSVLFISRYLPINILLILLLSVISAIILKYISDFIVAIIEKIMHKIKSKKCPYYPKTT